MASDSDSGPELEVVKVLGERKKTSKGPLEYLVRWKGFGADEDSWVTSRNMPGSKEVLKAYKSLPKTPAKTRGRPRSKSSSRSRSTSKGRKSKSKSPARQKKATPVRQSVRTSRTEVKTSSHTEAGDVEELKTEIVKEEPGHFERQTRVVTKTVSGASEVDGNLVRQRQTVSKSSADSASSSEKPKRWWMCSCGPMTSLRNSCNSMCNADSAVLAVFAVITIIVVSFLLEKYVNFQEIWETISGVFHRWTG